MATNVSVSVEGDDQLRLVVRGLNPGLNPAPVRRALVTGGLMIQEDAALNQIRHGAAGAPPIPDILTNRRGGAGGVGSIRVDRGGLPNFFVEIGSDLRYMRLHEAGDTVDRPAHTRTLADGRLVNVRAHTATFPKRAYLAPAIEAVAPDIEDVFLDEWEKELNI